MGPWALAIDPLGHFADVLNSADVTLSIYAIGAGGALSPLASAPVATGSQQSGITISHDGRFACVASHLGGRVCQCAAGSDGSLKAPATATVASGAEPFMIATTY